MAMASIDVPMTKLLDRSQKRAERTIHLREKETKFGKVYCFHCWKYVWHWSVAGVGYSHSWCIWPRLCSAFSAAFKTSHANAATIERNGKNRWSINSMKCCATAIASSALEDFGIIKGSDTRNIIDPSKMKREWKKTRVETTQLQRSSEGSLLALYFDGKKNETIYCEKKTVLAKENRW